MDIRQVAEQFAIEGTIERVESYGNGHINDTYLVTTYMEAAELHYILQRINTSIFQKPDELMKNILGVTKHLRKKILEAGGDVTRETLTVISTCDGKSYYETPEGECYRVYVYVENTISLEKIQNTGDFYAAAKAFGSFQYLLADYPADTLYETIPDFHNTKKRYERFLTVLKADCVGRAAEVAEEIAFVKRHAADMSVIVEALLRGEIPLRVTHNDTKLNNILMDKDSGKGICIIDLDTVMPGSSLYDFGDAIRFGANHAAEDEVELKKVWVDLELFEAYVSGYIKGCKGALKKREIELMPMGAKIMTLECGMRFLTDYLEGDTYFKIHREKHNLDRCRSQFKLVIDMEEKWGRMCEIVKRVSQ